MSTILFKVISVGWDVEWYNGIMIAYILLCSKKYFGEEILPILNNKKISFRG